MQESLQVNERRQDERIIVHGQVQFSELHTDNYRTAILEDFSQLGMLVFLEQPFSVGSKINIKVDPEDELDEGPLVFTVEVVRIAGQSEDNQYGYGCRILEHNLH